MGARTMTNQPPPLEGYDAFAANPWIAPALARAELRDFGDEGSRLGRFVGSAEGQQLARDANRFPPELATHDRFGDRIDAVEYHPSYHALMSRAFGAGIHSKAWTRPSAPFTAHATLFYLWNQVEQGTACPVTMTFASLPVLKHAPQLEREWRARILADAYDPRPIPATGKTGVTIGMAMTEKQGGSDLRSVETQAVASSDGAYRLLGHKWFCSAPMSDAFLTLARLEQGVTCFFVPRSLPDGSRNPFFIQRLKDKCGNRSNASAEIEYGDTRAWLVGEPGRGIATLIEMAHHTRFDIVVGVAGMMRMGLDHAVHHAMHREAFGKRLVEQPLMANVLADLALEAEAAALLAFRLARSFDRAAAGDTRESALQRALTPIAKYWLCKRITPFAVEAMECLGGNGYVEEAPLARLYREAPVNGIWEGSGNVICLDVLRALSRSAEAFSALEDEIAAAPDSRTRRLIERAGKTLADPATAEPGARFVVEALALGISASLMKRFSDPSAAEAFCVSRLEAPSIGHAFGTLPAGFDAAALVERARLMLS
ncbi:MAG: acyl-CoA dehydrogenase family protein [Bacillota bacterium]